MITLVDVIQLLYEIPSTILLIIFVFLLTREIIFYKNPIYNNQFYPFILYKGYVDILNYISTLFCSRAAKMNIFGSLYKDNKLLASYYYIIVGATYTVMHTITFITSFNRFTAIVYPFYIDKWFSKARIKLYILITMCMGLLYGFGFLYFKPYYIYFPPIKGYYVVFESQKAPYYVTSYTLCLILPIAVCSSIMNIVTIYKLSKYYKDGNVKGSLHDVSLIIYSILSFSCFSLFFIYNMSRVINFIFIKSSDLENIANTFIYWIIDLEIFGLFYAVLFLR
uniref:7TM_GPCR_Srx domain-containing protein n=1 Tax=Strongyloides venezuelensis TaxID=75913 RepID=A0A0K0FCW8_STRVS